MTTGNTPPRAFKLALELDDVPAKKDYTPALVTGPNGFAERQASVLADDKAAKAMSAATGSRDLLDPIFQFGTELNQLGLKNASKFRADWEAMPTVEDVMSSTIAAVADQKRRDYETDSGSISFNRETAEMTIHGGDGGPIPLTSDAMRALALRLQMGNGTGQCLTNGVTPPESVAWLLNSHVGKQNLARIVTPAEATNVTELVFRTWRVEGRRAAFATVSPGYTAFDADQIAQCVTVAMQKAGIKGARGQGEIRGAKSFFEIHYHSNLPATGYSAGEIFSVVTRVQSHDGGGGSATVQNMVQRNRCKNLYTLDTVAMQIDSIRHSGGVEKFAGLVYKSALDAFDHARHFIEKWGFAQNDVLTLDAARGKTPETLVRAVVSGLADRKGSVIGKRAVDSIVSHYFASDATDRAQGGVVSRSGIADAISRYAHHDVSDRWSAAALEDAAGRLTWSDTPINRYASVSVLNG